MNASCVIEARACWLVEPGRAEIRRTVVPPPGPDEVLVRTSMSGISRGTESLVFAGRVPASLHLAMRCPFQEGDFPAPVKYGYASVGVVEAGAPALIGRRVFCLYPHQDRYVVPAEAVVPLPDAVPDRRALLAANMETALNGLWDAAPLPCDRIAVVGAGTVGALMAALAARIPGTTVEIVDIDHRRAALAAALGCRFAAPEHAARDADLVIHASGSAAGLATALALAGHEATVLEMSWYGAGPVPAPLGEAFHARRLRLVASQVGSVAPARRARRSRRQRLEQAMGLLSSPVFDHLLSGESAFAALPETLGRLARAPDGVLCHATIYP
jgi:2-desacetyl-2-hydroxyethyl bacteriochlorophyllide A dehydrogenase